MKEKIKFVAVVKEVNQWGFSLSEPTKPTLGATSSVDKLAVNLSGALVSLDKSARVILETEDLSVMDLGKWPADETVSVIICRNPK